MCPLCLGTAALLASGGTSAGGLAALLLHKPLRRRAMRRSLPPRADAPGPDGRHPLSVLRRTRQDARHYCEPVHDLAR